MKMCLFRRGGGGGGGAVLSCVFCSMFVVCVRVCGRDENVWGRERDEN